jgi:hypothetical protein
VGSQDNTAPAGSRVVGRTIAAAALSTVLGSLPVFLLAGLAVLVRRTSASVSCSSESPPASSSASPR